MADDKAVERGTAKVRLVNLERDIKTIEWFVSFSGQTGNVKGKDRQKIVLGSTDDKGVVDAPQPEVEVDREIYEAMLKSETAGPAWRAWKDESKVAVYSALAV